MVIEKNPLKIPNVVIVLYNNFMVAIIFLVVIKKIFSIYLLNFFITFHTVAIIRHFVFFVCC